MNTPQMARRRLNEINFGISPEGNQQDRSLHSCELAFVSSNKARFQVRSVERLSEVYLPIEPLFSPKVQLERLKERFEKSAAKWELISKEPELKFPSGALGDIDRVLKKTRRTIEGTFKEYFYCWFWSQLEGCQEAMGFSEKEMHGLWMSVMRRVDDLKKEYKRLEKMRNEGWVNWENEPARPLMTCATCLRRCCHH